MSSKNKAVHTGADVYYLPEADEIIVFDRVEYNFEKVLRTGKLKDFICMYYVTRPYFGSKKLQASGEKILIGQV